MNGNQSFNLLEGTYLVENARYLILSCFNEQILFHNRELLRRKIYGGDIQEVEMEIEKLESKRKQVLNYFKLNEGADKQSLIVTGAIEIRWQLRVF